MLIDSLAERLAFERTGTRRLDALIVKLRAARGRAEGPSEADLMRRLRERPGDVELLVRHFVDRFARKMNKRIDSIASESMAALKAYPWPGNVRELENILERAVILSDGPTLAVPRADLTPAASAPASSKSSPPPSARATVPPAGASPTELPSALLEVERTAVVKALEECRWQVGGPRGAAAKLGISRTTLQGKMRRLGIQRPD